MRLKLGGILAMGCAISLIGCGSGGGGGSRGGGGGGSGGGSHTYVIVPPAKSGGSGIYGGGSGIYVTIVSPVAVPASILTQGGARIVGHAQGPQKCSYTREAEGLKGKTVTLKLSGTSSFVSRVCSTQPRAHFDPTWLP